MWNIFIFFQDSPTEVTLELILMHDGSKHVESCKDVPVLVHMITDNI